jgi:hypothetical protein
MLPYGHCDTDDVAHQAALQGRDIAPIPRKLRQRFLGSQFRQSGMDPLTKLFHNLCAYSSCDDADNDDHLEQVDTESERCNR